MLRITILSAVFFLSTLFAYSQDAVALAPEFLNQPELLTSEPQLHSLEKVEGEVGAKMKALGYGGSEGFLHVPGQRSPVRFAAGTRLIFRIKVASTETDPAGYIKLGAMRIHKKRREMLLSKNSMFKSKSVKNVFQLLDFKKVNGEVLEISPSNLLPAGEYAFSVGSTMLFAFGIDN